ncbi:hypothetical protein [Bernardetia sp.]|uniref:hypothetical protein n=1 Tax=Bernardetia sp. TaxID=1937974 RepID=UPI0025C1053B|nr:hypothetical protein [Bernardetia sp.]
MIKNILRSVLDAFGYEARKKYVPVQHNTESYANLGEDTILASYFDKIRQNTEVNNDFIVDIAASDGITMSNTFVFFRDGYKGVAVEYDSEKFAFLSNLYKIYPNVQLLRTKALPDTVTSLLKVAEAPKDFLFLNLDIDSYDYFILENILSEYRPKVICTEINEQIPYPTRFTVTYHPDTFWQGDNFFGYSVAMLEDICQKYDYEVVNIHYNNAFLVPKEINEAAKLNENPASIAELYKAGYLNQADRKVIFAHNAGIDHLLEKSPEEVKHFLKQEFAKYEGKYILE